MILALGMTTLFCMEWSVQNNLSLCVGTHYTFVDFLRNEWRSTHPQHRLMNMACKCHSFIKNYLLPRAMMRAWAGWLQAGGAGSPGGAD